jgi:phospholipase/carboxylesterase
MAALECIEVETGPNPGATVLILHGLGADGHDFVPIAEQLDLRSAGDVRFVFPHAPVIPVTLNNGMRMRAWYDIYEMDLVRREDEFGLQRSRGDVEALLLREKERGVPAGRIVLAGFSQGSAVALLTGLRHRERLAGIVGLSGYLPLAATTAAERAPANAATPVFMGHGRADDVVAIERGLASRDALVALGQPVEWHDYAMPHSVCMEEIADLGRWLQRVLARA